MKNTNVKNVLSYQTLRKISHCRVSNKKHVQHDCQLYIDSLKKHCVYKDDDDDDNKDDGYVNNYGNSDDYDGNFDDD